MNEQQSLANGPCMLTERPCSPCGSKQDNRPTCEVLIVLLAVVQ